MSGSYKVVEAMVIPGPVVHFGPILSVIVFQAADKRTLARDDSGFGRSKGRLLNPKTASRLLDLGLWVGVAYFCTMATAHFFGIKWPLLFVYYDVPFYAYQDKIISFAVMVYVCLFASAARNREVVPAALVALGITVLGLCAVNTSDDLAEVLNGRSTAVYWTQTGLIAAYAAILTVLYRSALKPSV